MDVHQELFVRCIFNHSSQDLFLFFYFFDIFFGPKALALTYFAYSSDACSFLFLALYFIFLLLLFFFVLNK